jgi:hypothetical protein
MPLQRPCQTPGSKVVDDRSGGKRSVSAISSASNNRRPRRWRHGRGWCTAIAFRRQLVDLARPKVSAKCNAARALTCRGGQRQQTACPQNSSAASSDKMLP